MLKVAYADMTSKQKHVKRNREIVCHAIRRNNLSKNSIAIKNPLYNSSGSEWEVFLDNMFIFNILKRDVSLRIC